MYSKSLNLLQIVDNNLQVVSQLANVVQNWQGSLILNGLSVIRQENDKLKDAVSRAGSKVFLVLLLLLQTWI
jgi:hypothetical protein